MSTIRRRVKMLCKLILGVSLLIIMFDTTHFCQEDINDFTITEEDLDKLKMFLINIENDKTREESSRIIEYLVKVPEDLMKLYSISISGGASDRINRFKSLKIPELDRFLDYLETLPENVKLKLLKDSVAFYYKHFVLIKLL